MKSLLTECDCLPMRAYASPLRCPIAMPYPVMGFRYLEISKQGDFWIAEETNVLGQHIRAVGSNSEEETRTLVRQNKWTLT